MKKGFYPEEVIFEVTQSCNMNCGHCFVTKSSEKLEFKNVEQFLLECKKAGINRIGFTGGEPFLNLNFILEAVTFAVNNDFLFDQIATNGDWWKNPQELFNALQQLYEVGYDGKFCLSWDNFHGQSPERMFVFIKTVQQVFGENVLNVQYVTDDNGSTEILQSLEQNFATIPVYKMPQTFSSENQNAWNKESWFTEDYCQGPGNILFVHTNGTIAPCCGFANENPQLLIGTINDSFETIMKKAAENKMVKQCFYKGLSRLRRSLKLRKKIPGKTTDNCTFCEWACKNC